MKKFFTKKNRPIIIAVSILLVLAIAITTTCVILILNFEDTDNGIIGVYSENGDSSVSDKNGASSNSSSSGSSSSDNGSSSNSNTVLNPGTYEKVEYKAMPTLNGVTLSESQMLGQYRGYTDWRIYCIRTAKDEIKPKSGGTAYYVSNKGSYKNDGLSPDTPLRTLGDLGKIKSKLKAGDVVYFERGSIFRGQLIADVEGITYAAYGEGKKPTFYASPGNAAEKGEWVQTENKNVYRYSLSYKGKDVGTIVFNDGEQHGIKCIIRTESNGDTYNNTTGEKFSTYKDLKHNLHFYHDYNGTGFIYLYCKDGNPADVFDSIELSIKQHIISVQADNVHFDNLCLKYGGAHGIGAGTRKGLTVTNCEFGWIGGSIQAEGIFGRNHATRYGNAVEIYGGCDDFEVSNCYFYQIYDAAVTFQYSTSGSSDITMKNVDFSNNVMEYCNYSVEYFLSGGTASTSYIQNVKIDNNLMWYTGYGLCEQRPDKTCDAHIKSWGHTNARKGSFNITNNLFALSKTYLIQSNASNGTHSPTYSGNTYIQYENGYLGMSGSQSSKLQFDSSVQQNISSMLGDNSSKVIFVK